MSARITTSTGLLVVSLIALLAILGGAWYVHGSPWQRVEIENPNQVLAGPAIYAVPGTNLPVLPNLPDFSANNVLYENKELGIALRVPKSSMNITCAKDESGKFVERMAPVPVEVWQEGKNIIIGPSYSEKVDGTGEYSICDHTNKDASSPHWKIEVFDHLSQSEVESFLQKRYGNKCRLAGSARYPETPTEPMPEQEGIVRMKMEAVDPNTIMETESDCLTHLMSDDFLFYGQQKLMIIDNGPEPAFWLDQLQRMHYDADMIRSIKFLSSES